MISFYINQFPEDIYETRMQIIYEIHMQIIFISKSDQNLDLLDHKWPWLSVSSWDTLQHLLHIPILPEIQDPDIRTLLIRHALSY